MSKQTIYGIGFAGRMKSGKDTTASLLLKHPDFSSNFKQHVRLSFANQLKSIAQELCHLTPDDVNTQAGKLKYIPEYGKTVREILQGIGEGMRDYVHPDIWVKALEHDLKEAVESNKFFIVTDVRRKNEADLIHKYNGIIVRIDRKAVEPKPGTQDHVSEIPLTDDICDESILNIEDDFEHLEHSIWSIYTRYLLGLQNTSSSYT